LEDILDQPRNRYARLLLIAILVSSCGSHEDAAQEQSLAQYCALVSDYLTNVSDHPRESLDPEREAVTAMIQVVARRTELARELATVAPASVRTAHQTIARAAEAMTDRLESQPIVGVEEFTDAYSTISEELTLQFGDLHAESLAIETFVSNNC
jgi:hypothetical protein